MCHDQRFKYGWNEKELNCCLTNMMQTALTASTTWGHAVVLGKRSDIDPDTKSIVQKVKNVLIKHGGANGLRSMTVILRRLDRNGNGKLDEDELHRVRSWNTP